jgi:GDP-4-dehydro-6-deoxy-D-mannose reductase
VGEGPGVRVMRILITGVTGFAGSYLAEALLADGVELHGTSATADAALPSSLKDRVTIHVGDLTEPAHLSSLLHSTNPEQIYHLAGYASAGQSFQEPEAAWLGNATLSERLFEAVLNWGGAPRILHVSSALIYAPADPPDRPLNESAPIDPKSPYAASKAAADRMAEEFARNRGLDIVRVRPFNHIGPRQSPQFAVGTFAQQLARIEAGKAPPRLETGDLTARRDFTDVRDMVHAYIALMKDGVRGEAYNVGSGSAVSMTHVLDLMRAECRIPVEVVTQPSRLRSTDVSVLVADSTKVRRATGWSPRIPLERTLHDTLEYWRICEGSVPSRSA